MIGELESSSSDLCVVGGGVAGLLFGARAQDLGYCVRLIEKNDRVGGLIQTTSTPLGISESAAHSLLASPQVFEWAHLLGVELVSLQERARYIVRDGRMRRFPLTFFELIDLSKRIFSREHQAGRDLESWAKTHIGEAALEYLLRPFLVGVFGAQAHEISQELAFPGLSVPQGSSFFRVLRNRPKKRRAPMVAPRKGMQDFVRALELKIGNRLTLNHELRTLPQGNVAVCTDAHSAGRLLEAVEPELAMRLKQIRYSPLVSATVWANAKDFSRSPKGVGVLFAPCEQRSVLGVLFNSSSFSERTWDPKVHSFTAMLGGTLDPTAIYLSDQEIEARVRSEFASTLGWRGDQMSLKIYRWPRAVPVYSEDLRKTLEYARERLSQRKGLVLFGNYTGSVSIRGMMESTWSLRR